MDTQQICQHCTKPYSPRRKDQKTCGAAACRQKQSRLKSGQLVQREAVCPATGETFVTTDSRKVFKDRDTMNAFHDGKKNRAAYDFHMSKQSMAWNLYFSGEQAALAKMIENDLNNPDTATRQMFNLDYLLNPMRNVYGEVSAVQHGVFNRRDADSFYKSMKNTIGQDILDLFFDRDSNKRTYVEICNAYCKAKYGKELAAYIARQDHFSFFEVSAAPERLVDLTGITDEIMYVEAPAQINYVKEYSNSAHCPKNMRARIRYQATLAKGQIHETKTVSKKTTGMFY